MKPSRSRLLLPLVPATVLLVHVALMYRAALRHTGGVVSYPVDDTFIHLSLAKHLAFSGVYGVSSHAFAAASSSVGWPLLLALSMKIAGPHDWLPLALNAAFGVALVYVIDAVALRLVPGISALSRVLAGLAAVVLTPLPTLVVLGMEHMAHTVGNVAFIAAASSWLASEANDEPARERRVMMLAGLAAFVTLWRYEGAFPIMIVCALALLRRRWRSAIVIGVAGALPGVSFGLYAKAKGSLFLPVPVVLKGRHIEWGKLGDILGIDLMDRFGTEAPVLAVSVACAILGVYLIQKRGLWSPIPLTLVITLAASVMHLELASLGWFYRYESYLLATGIAFLVMGLASVLPPIGALADTARRAPARTALVTLAIVLLAMPLRRRAVSANDDTPSACKNIFHQQMQIGRFLSRFESVAVNDIGAVAWQREAPFVDLVGLGNLEVARAKELKLHVPLRREDIRRLTPGVKVAIIYEEWFGRGVPANWLRVGRWYIQGNKSCAFAGVSIFATDPESYPEVIEALRSFSPELPKGIVEHGRYIRWPKNGERLTQGDEVLIVASVPELTGAQYVDEDGEVYLRGAGKVPIARLTPSEAVARMGESIAEAKAPTETEEFDVRTATVTRVERLNARRPSVHVAGNVDRGMETLATTLPSAILAAGGSPSSPAWAWREQAGRFVKVPGAALEAGGLEDGDIIIVE